MNTVELAVERVAGLDEPLVAKLLAWLDNQQATRAAQHPEPPLGAQAFALREGRAPRTTAVWMKEFREGESASD